MNLRGHGVSRLAWSRIPYRRMRNPSGPSLYLIASVGCGHIVTSDRYGEVHRDCHRVGVWSAVPSLLELEECSDKGSDVSKNITRVI